MLRSGLVSITFRKKTPLEICALCKKANLSCVEWGGDVHVPPKGNKAKETLHLTKEHGLLVSSYGSYFRLGQGAGAFMYNLEEAVNLTAPVIRIWAGTAGSREYHPEERKALTEELMMVSEKAYDANVRVALEYHPNTLMDDRESVKQLMKETKGEAYSPLFYWQPRWTGMRRKRFVRFPIWIAGFRMRMFLRGSTPKTGFFESRSRRGRA